MTCLLYTSSFGIMMIRAPVQNIDLGFGTNSKNFSTHLLTCLLYTSDHPTPVSARTHTADPVPYLLYDSRKHSFCGGSYCERAARESGRWAVSYTHLDVYKRQVRDMVLWFVNTMERVCEKFRNRLNKPVDSVKMKNGLIF